MERKKAAAPLPELVGRQVLVKKQTNEQTKNTQNSGVLDGQEFQRESIKAMLSNGGRKHQQIISELVELRCPHHLQKTLMHT